jgi:hypothetical protein
MIDGIFDPIEWYLWFLLGFQQRASEPGALVG